MAVKSLSFPASKSLITQVITKSNITAEVQQNTLTWYIIQILMKLISL